MFRKIHLHFKLFKEQDKAYFQLQQIYSLESKVYAKFLQKRVLRQQLGNFITLLNF